MADKETPDEEEQNSKTNNGPMSLKDELEVVDLSCCIFFKDQKIFAAAGPGLPLLQMNTDGTFISLDPNLPYRQEVHEEVIVTSDEHGRMFDALGELRKLTGMKYKGREMFFVKERHPDNGQNLAAWFDDDMNPHYLRLGETILSAIMVLRVRDRMLDGELSTFPEILSD